jgi:L-malate glycosyltransferase
LTVLHVFSGDLWAGAEVMIFNLMSCLGEEPSLRVIALALNDGILASKLEAAGITTIVIPEKTHAFAGILRRAAALLKGEHIDAIHAHRYKENLLAWFLARRLGVHELITTIHGLPEPGTLGSRRAWASRLRMGLNYWLMRRAFGCVVAVSDEMKRVLVGEHGFLEDRVRVIRNGISLPPRAVVGSKREGFHIGTVGRLVPVKGFDLFLEVAAKLRRESSLVRFSLLGDGPLREALGRRVAELGLGDCVEFLAPRQDPIPYYRSLDLYINTSLHEGIPLSVLEAMACGIPVVSSAVGGIPEIVTHGQHGFLVEGRDPDRFAEPCRTLMQDDALRRRIGEQAAASTCAHFSASAMARAYRQLYGERAARARSDVAHAV